MKTESHSSTRDDPIVMPQCSHYTTQGHQCHNQAVPGHADVPAYIPCCRIHARSHARHVAQLDGQQPAPLQCIFHHGGREPGWCVHGRAEDSAYCPLHVLHYVQRHRAQVEQDARVREEGHVREFLLAGLIDQNPQPTWRVAAAELHVLQGFPRRILYQAAYAYYIRVDDAPETAIFRAEWALLDAAARQPPPPPRIIRATTLGELARDGQNVHTRYVVEQTRDLEEKLLAIPIPESQQTEITLSQEWIRLMSMRIRWGAILKTLNDVHRWFSQSDCRAAGDNLYRRMLRGVVAKINRTDGEMRDELYRRLWEECFEATGMCCEGHLSRLCNVFVGFDEAFKPPVSLGELLQQKMAAIAMSDLSDSDKLQQATAFFDEVGLPQADRVAWLDAF